MKLLLQEDYTKLVPGTKVTVYWFQPKKPKEGTPFSRFYNGRDEYLEQTWQDETIDSLPWMSASDGWIIKLRNRFGAYCINRMRLK